MISGIFANPATTRALKGLQANSGRKLLFVTMTTLTLPRIFVDYRRNKYAGQESAFYELVSIFNNYAMPGVIALGIAHALGKINNPLGVRTTGWAKSEYLDPLAAIYKDSVEKAYEKPFQSSARSETLRHFIYSTLEKLEGVEPLQHKPIKLSKEQLKQFTADIQGSIAHSQPGAKAARRAIADKLAETLGTYDRLILKGKVDLSARPDVLIQHLHYLGQEFQKSHTSNTPAKITENIGTIVRKLQQSITVKSWLSLGIVSAVGFGMQFINRWITRRRTGQRGFVGYSDFDEQVKSTTGGTLPQNAPMPQPSAARQAENPKTLDATPNASEPDPRQLGFIGNSDFGVQAKSDSGSALPSNPLMAQPPLPGQAWGLQVPAAAMPEASNPNPRQLRFAGMMPGLMSSQFTPTASQLNYFIYPIGGIGRVSAARDLSELRETALKSGFAMASLWLVPNLVDNLVAASFKNEHVFNNVQGTSKTKSGSFLNKLQYGFRQLNESSVRSYRDIEAYSKKLGEQLARESDAQIQKQLPTILKQVSPALKNLEGLTPEAKAQRITEALAKELNRIKNISSLSGIVYGFLTLGIGLNLLNIYITNKKRARQMAEQQVAQSQSQLSASPLNSPGQGDYAAVPPVFIGFSKPFQVPSPK